MQAQERALLDMANAHPDEDGPRLVYADWLEENGQCARAEFIQAQCRASFLESPEGGAHANHPDAEKNCVLCADVVRLRCRERELWQAHRDEWVKAFMPGGCNYWSNAHDCGWTWPDGPHLPRTSDGVTLAFTRGLPGYIGLRHALFRRRAGELFRYLPTLTSVALIDRTATSPAEMWEGPAGHENDFVDEHPQVRGKWCFGQYEAGEEEIGRDRRWWLTRPLFGVLRGFSEARYHDGGLWFDSQAQALRQLDKACVAFGRMQAMGLGFQVGAASAAQSTGRAVSTTSTTTTATFKLEYQ